jgi:hypothetical protein
MTLDITHDPTRPSHRAPTAAPPPKPRPTSTTRRVDDQATRHLRPPTHTNTRQGPRLAPHAIYRTQRFQSYMYTVLGIDCCVVCLASESVRGAVAFTENSSQVKSTHYRVIVTALTVYTGGGRPKPWQTSRYCTLVDVNERQYLVIITASRLSPRAHVPCVQPCISPFH